MLRLVGMMFLQRCGVGRERDKLWMRIKADDDEIMEIMEAVIQSGMLNFVQGPVSSLTLLVVLGGGKQP